MELAADSLKESEELGRALGACLEAGDTVLLTGELGAGKSVLARAIARALGVEGPMPSPTFTLMQPYQGRCGVCHFDLYRLSDAEEFYAAGLDEPLGRDVCLVEWPMEDVAFAPPVVRIKIGRGATAQARVLSVRWEGLGARAARIEEALKRWEAGE